jgi:histidinol-phosphate/aromatic aminotransferase/cobyric acid decarboxylase-like protein
MADETSPTAETPSELLDLALDKNEYNFAHAPSVLEAVWESFPYALSRYAKASLKAFAARLSEGSGVPQELLKLTHGGEDALLKALLLLRPRYTRLVLPELSWHSYREMAEPLGYVVEETPVREQASGFVTDLKSLDNALSQGERALVILGLPNNPTGHAIEPGPLEALIDRHPRHRFILDGVYNALSNAYVRMVEQFPQALYVGSFSKFYGLPGMRIGFLAGEETRAIMFTLGLSPAGMRACAAALNEHEHYDQNRRYALAIAAELVAASTDDARFYPTEAGFILMKPSSRFTDRDYDRAERISGVKPRYLTLRGEKFLRWTLGDARAAAAIRSFVAQLTA